MSATYVVKIYSPFNSMVINRTDANPQTIHSFDPAITITPAAGWFTISNISPATPLSDVMITATLTATGALIRQWRAETTYGRIEIPQAQNYSVTIDIRYDHYVPPYTTFIVRAAFNCGGIRFRTTSGEHYSVDTHGGQVTVNTTDNLTIYTVYDLNGNSVSLSKCYAYDISYRFTRWNLGEDSMINAVSGGGVTREVLIKVATNIPLFQWEDNDDLIITLGTPISAHITAARWNSFIDTIYEIRQLCDLAWTKNHVSSGDTITAAIFNNAGSALNELPDITRQVYLVEAGDIIRASYFVGTYSLKDVLNQEIQYLNNS